MFDHNKTNGSFVKTLLLAQFVGKAVERFRPNYFSPQEWWFHLVLVLLIFPSGSYINIGPRYLTDGAVFALGTLWGLAAYCLGVGGITITIRHVFNLYPRFQDNLKRTVVMIALVNLYGVANTLNQYSLLCAVPFFGKTFSWTDLKQMWLMGMFVVTAVCIMANLIYAYQQWGREQAELGKLKNQTLQHQLEGLRQQVNPHFLFNSLSSISALVGEEPQQAEWFVEHLAKIYRYILQASNRPQVVLANELSFLNMYTELLQVRYGSSLQIDLPRLENNLPLCLPALSLQVLVDNAIRHNTMSVTQPLLIQVSLVGGSAIRVTNSLQPKRRRLDIDRQGLAKLVALYGTLTSAPVRVEQTAHLFQVTLPLLGLAETTGPE